MSIPLLDVSLLQAGTTARGTYLRDLVQSFKDFGFVRLKNHGIPAKRIAQMFTLVCQCTLGYLDTHILAEY